ncbi:uncharacterized protein LOC112637109 [Camponotus floridanus]|uniref:uncharacterized protein LOC112637109 n=1 Tax=Camponotus floridanus TaxID=104421 RepID=UPI000DC69B5E|nr:uncharacterized protein LOC112637109 [Camponotus floridanus]
MCTILEKFINEECLLDFIELTSRVPADERISLPEPFGQACDRVYSRGPYGLSVRVDLSTGTRQVRLKVPWEPLDLPGLWARLRFQRQLDSCSFWRLACERRAGRSGVLQPLSRS